MKHFTVEEALELLPDVISHVERMVGARAQLLEREAAMPVVAEGIHTNGSGPTDYVEELKDRKLAKLHETLIDELNALEKMGIQVKDVNTGLVDFPAIHPVTGDTVFLCWQLGEATIAFWHERDTGFPGRKPLPFT